jgi:hypothetical protein
MIVKQMTITPGSLIRCDSTLSDLFKCVLIELDTCSGVPENFVRAGGGDGSTNTLKDTGQREGGFGGAVAP